MILRPGANWIQQRSAAAAAVWIVLFFIAFFSFDLPNSTPKTSRWDVASNLHFLYLELVDPLDDDAGKNSGWRFFPQRLLPLGTALFLLVGAGSLGGLLLRSIVPRNRLTLGEFLFFAFAVGLSASSLLVLCCGLSGFLSRGFIGGLLAGCTIVSLSIETWSREGWIRGAAHRLRRSCTESNSIPASHSKEIPYESIIRVICGGACLPFVLCMLLGASLPSTDFDVKAYHLEGAKEFFQNGEIAFLPHNVYTSFPFLTEMLLLEGMMLTGDWWVGALAGQLLLMGFGPLTGWGVFLAGRRWWGPAAGWLAMLIHLSAPWTYRISTIAYAEGGLTYYLFASLFAALLIRDRLNAEAALQPIRGECLLAGLLAGSAMACKYPGLISVVIPIAGFVKAMMYLVARRRCKRFLSRTVILNASALGLGIVLAVGPWLMKNLVETGNPVYPLMYSLFGGVDWDAEMNAKWIRGHSTKEGDYSINHLAMNIIDVTLKSDWLSPLLFGLAPLALLVRKQRSLIVLLWIYGAYLFGTWWLLTHRIDRFWVPLIPVVSLLAGVGLTWSDHRYWVRTATAAVVFAWTFNLGFVTTGLCGNNAYLLDLNVARINMANITSPEIVLLNHIEIPPGESVLSIGDAEVFDAEFPINYHTVFDQPILDDWWGVPQPGVPRSQWPQRDPAEIHSELRERNIAYVYVNWSEILRYRMTYRYKSVMPERFGEKRPGYTEYVIPERFRALQRAGVLGRNVPQNQAFADFDRFPGDKQKEIEDWAPELIVTLDGKKYFITSEIFPVR